MVLTRSFIRCGPKLSFGLRGWLCFFLIVNMSVSSCNAIQSSAPFKQRPNVIIILTDDLDFSLMPFVKNTEALIGKNGATFTNYFVTTPLCCPSRSSMIRGQYPHNTRVLSNDFPAGSFRRFFVDGDESETLAVWLKRAGYQTSLIGKYLNGYPILQVTTISLPVGQTGMLCFINCQVVRGIGITGTRWLKMGRWLSMITPLKIIVPMCLKKNRSNLLTKGRQTANHFFFYYPSMRRMGRASQPCVTLKCLRDWCILKSHPLMKRI